MALPNISSPELQDREGQLLSQLVNLYEEELQVYRQILQLSRQQGGLIRQGSPIAEIRQVLEKKKNCLAIVSRLEATEKNAKLEWDQNRQNWSARSRTHLHEVLERVGSMIEQILICEEANDLQFIEQTRAM